MAKKKGLQNTSSIETRSFNKGMVKDLNEGLMGEGMYLHARNANNNSRSGDIGVIGNESSNKFCTQAPFTVIGAIHITGDDWVIFSTDDINSEIGRFDESTCTYTKIVNDQCLGFKRTNPILGGETKENFDCTFQVYFADDLNPDRSLNIDNPPFIEFCETVDDCRICVDTKDLDCEAIRMARLTTPPCIRLKAGPNGGELLNGTYQAVIGYTENEQRITDYSLPSNIVSMFDHRDVNGSLEVIIETIDQTYDEFELVIIGFVNEQLVARRMGIYSTHQNSISIDRIDPAVNVTVPLQFIPIDRPSYERSQGIYRNGDFLVRVAPTTRFSFNYQPLANDIITEWVETRYPKDYYRKAGTSVGYMRDEVYSLFIRFIYNTYDKSESYHIPGRAPGVYFIGGSQPVNELDPSPSTVYPTGERIFEVYNTALFTSTLTGTTQDGGQLIKKGLMGYWESTEKYPDNKPDVWGDLCGKQIRHHKMPENALTNHFEEGNQEINVLGVQFRNISAPVDNQGNVIPGIIGYEILRGTREGNKTIVAKGIINNMGNYTREDNSEIVHYQNYPYNDLRNDPFLSEAFVNNDTATTEPLGGDRYSKDKFTFHSPDTQFKHPFLSAQELKVYETLLGNGEARFVEPYKHPEHKVIADFGFILSALVGFGAAIAATQGETKTVAGVPYVPDANWAIGGTSTGTNTIGTIPAAAAAITGSAAITIAQTTENLTGAASLINVLGLTVGDSSLESAATLAASQTASIVPGVVSASYYEWDTNGKTGLPGVLRILTGIPTFLTYWSETTDNFIRLIKAFSRYRQHTLAFQSHCFYDRRDFSAAGNTNYRAAINDASYIGNRIQEFGEITVNNLFRNNCVGLTTNNDIPDPIFTDQTRRLYSDVWGSADAENRNVEFTMQLSSVHYAALKSRLRNQYGQVDGIIQVPTSSCMQEFVVDPTNPQGFTSEVIFGGDTYIGRYTEKNTFFYFFDWMFDLPDGFEWDYRLRKMIPFPTYWMDTKDFQINDFVSGIFAMFNNQTGTSAGLLPSDFHNFERDQSSFGGGGIPANAWSQLFTVKNAHMYLFNSGVRDFFVESEVNIEYRDWGDEEAERHYDPYLHTSYYDMFRTDIIKDSNFYKYNYSLSASRFFQGYPNWSIMQYRNYDPVVAEVCYTHYPNRVIYSLPQELELRYDNWLVYLANNYRDFTSRVTTMKPIGKNGAMLLFENEAPIQFIGVDQLQTDAGTKITIGDGGLFEQPLQNLVNADSSYEYGSCQDRLSVINTPAGLFWISQNQGKVFNYTAQLADISQQGMKWWFEEFLPYKILEDFPDFELKDNTVIGVGCQSVYDNSNGIVYFSKRDFKLMTAFEGRVTYAGDDNFVIAGGGSFKLGDSRYFDDASWTISYDPKSKSWVSFHDWHPNFMLPSKNNFLTIKNAGIWKHNDRSDNYCNFYGQDFPFEVELVTPTGQNVNTLRSVEYLMEVFQWDADGVDRHHVLDFNFDRAVVYNTEQISGDLRLNLTPKNNAPALVGFPQVNPNSIDILYSKEEQKYRFNQFWDITDDRGEFGNARRTLWNTDPNGYTKAINPLAVNYNKPQHQRKKFRHYQSNLWLRRLISGPHNMQLKLVNSKNQYSPR